MRDGLSCRHLKRAYLPPAFLYMAVFSTTALAGSIPGLPPMQPPDLQGNFQLQVSNDFFSVITNLDDYRTQQISLTGYFADDWLLVFDQSIMTARGPNRDLPDPPGLEGRLDQQSLSLGYRPWYQHSDRQTNQILFGGGFRRYGNFSGARIQNGAHYLFNSKPVDLPYVNTERTDAVAWIRISHQDFPWPQTHNRDWWLGYWLDGTVLLTSDAQSDGMIGAFGVWRYQDWEVWSGPRAEWRSGYDGDVVQESVAAHEQGVSWVLGIAYGPVRFETSAGLGTNDNSYGSLILSANADQNLIATQDTSQWAYQFTVLIPNFAIQNQFRWSPDKWRSEQGATYSLVFDYIYGTDARDDAGTSYTISNQYILGAEMRYSGHHRREWFQPYVMLGTGYRSEYIDGEGGLQSQQSPTVGSVVVAIDAGVRFHMSGKTDAWQVQLVVGATGWLPLQERQVSLNGQTLNLLQDGAAWYSGVSASFSY